MRSLLLLPLLACTASPPADVQPPFTGTAHRFAVDRFDLPRTSTQALEMGSDLDGDGAVDNQVGAIFTYLVNNADVPPHPEDLLAEGMLASSVTIAANDLDHDDHVGVTFAGAPETTDSIPAGGRIVDGTFVSNHARDATQAAQGTLVLPAMIDADPLEIPYRDGELELVPDGTGGYTGQLHATLSPDRVRMVVAAGLIEMGMSNPRDHQAFEALFDMNRNGVLELDETANNSLIKSWFAPDVTLDQEPRVSIGFQFHLVPCASGTCAPTALADSCHDRVRDGNETDVDCGGSTCQACGFTASCTLGTDCQSGACDGGVCRDPSCTDGIQNGFETTTDHGSNCSGR